MSNRKPVSASIVVEPNYLARVRFLPGVWNPVDDSPREVQVLQTIDERPVGACRNYYLTQFAGEARDKIAKQLAQANLFPFVFSLEGQNLLVQGLLFGEESDIFHESVQAAGNFESFEVQWQVIAIPGFSLENRRDCERLGKLKNGTEIDLDYLHAVYGTRQAAFFQLSSAIDVKFPRPGQPDPTGSGTLTYLRVDHIWLDGYRHTIESHSLTRGELMRMELPEEFA